MDYKDPIEAAKAVLMREHEEVTELTEETTEEEVSEESVEESADEAIEEAKSKSTNENGDDDDDDDDEEVEEGKLPPWLKKKKGGDDEEDVDEAKDEEEDDDDDDDEVNEAETILDVDDNQDAEGKKATPTPKGKKKAKDPKAQASKASGKIDKVSAKEHLEVLFSASNEELSEDFKTAASTIFEAAINDRVATIEEELRGDYDTVIAEHTEKISTELTERLDDYLNYVVEEWMKENEIAIEGGLRAEIAESFIGGLRELFENNSITIPDENYEILEGVVSKAEELESNLNEEIEKNIELRKELVENQCNGVFHKVSAGMVDTEVEKLRSLADGMEFDSPEQYKEKLNVIKENYFGKNAVVAEEKDTTTPSGEVKYESNGTIMDAYVDSLAKVRSK
jgi:hypothetical protein